jgi:argininosuccinate lyase
MKIWQKGKENLNKVVESFETKDDILLDNKLTLFDVKGSLAHAKMLARIGILTSKELATLETGLNKITSLYKAGKFDLMFGEEDIHSKIENYLTKNYGDVGKKIHTGRSRNDQVLTALRLYEMDELKKIKTETEKLIRVFKDFKKRYGKIVMPGYTHMQKAMPSSLGMWADSFISSLSDDARSIDFAHAMIDQSPLGSAAGYGLPIKIDRNYTAKVLGFAKVQSSPIYCQNSKGKFEAIILSSLISILMTINKFASDVMLFNTNEFGFFRAESEITTGSSIMPQKKNLDLAELLRSKVHLVLGNYTKMVSISANLISGYNRDLQDIKKPLMESMELTFDSLIVSQILIEKIIPDKKRLFQANTPELYATGKALDMTLKGMNFRDAYRKIGISLEKKEGGEKK